MTLSHSFRRVLAFVGVAFALSTVVAPGAAAPAEAQESYQRISGEGSSWSANAIDAMRVNVRQFGITVDFAPTGSTSGRKNWLNGIVDFAASDIPFQFEPEDGSPPENPAPGSYAYIPVTAGGTAFMYNLKINGKQVTNLRLSGENVAKIFTNQITSWDDPAIQRDNPGLVMPARPVVPVVRSDGSGSTAQFSEWMIAQHPAIWQDYCQRSGRAPACGSTSFYPVIAGSATVAQAGDLGVAGYVSQGFAEGGIGYVNYSYALGAQFPVVKVLNNAGFYTEPTPENVAVSLLKARINTNEADPTVYLTQQLDGVYSDTDPRNYQLSSYSYFILPIKVVGQFNEAKGRTLSAFAYYAMCQAQQQSASLGYSPMPVNLVQASFDQIRKIPGAEVQNIDIKNCNNPTFSSDGTNTLANNAPQPQACDRVDFASQCPDGTAGLRNVPTAVAAVGAGGGGGTTGGGATGGGTTGGAATGTTGGAAGGATTGTAAVGTTGGSVSGTTGAASTTGGTTAASTGGTAGGTTGAAASTGTTGTAGTTGATLDPTAGAPTGGVGVPTVDENGVVLDGCDPDTGICAEFANSPAGGGGVQQRAVSPVSTATLEQSGGWGGTQFLIVIVVLFTLALIVGPAIAWRQFNRTEAA